MPPDTPLQVGDRVVTARTVVMRLGRTGTVVRVDDLGGAYGVLVQWDDRPNGVLLPITAAKLDRLAPDHAAEIAHLFGVTP